MEDDFTKQPRGQPMSIPIWFRTISVGDCLSPLSPFSEVTASEKIQPLSSEFDPVPSFASSIALWV